MRFSPSRSRSRTEPQMKASPKKYLHLKITKMGNWHVRHEYPQAASPSSQRMDLRLTLSSALLGQGFWHHLRLFCLPEVAFPVLFVLAVLPFVPSCASSSSPCSSTSSSSLSSGTLSLAARSRWLTCSTG